MESYSFKSCSYRDQEFFTGYSIPPLPPPTRWERIKKKIRDWWNDYELLIYSIAFFIVCLLLSGLIPLGKHTPIWMPIWIGNTMFMMPF